MSKSVKSIASIALPIAGSLLLPGIGTALGSTLSAAALSGIGGAIGGAAGGALSGGGAGNILKGAVLGGAGGYLSNGGLTELGITGPNSLLGNAVGAPLSQVTGNAAEQGPTQGSGILGGVTRNAPSISSLLSGSSNSLTTPIIAGNIVSGVLGANASEDAAKLQYKSTQDALAQQKSLQQPFVDAGTGALTQYTNLAENPQAQADFVKNSPFYKSLADDAQRRLLASQATAGKINSGGTVNALQQQLLSLGNGLVSNQLSNLSLPITTGANAASGLATSTGNLITEGGNAQAAGTVGAYNAGNSAYQNTISSLLALQKLKLANNFPTYTPTPAGTQTLNLGG